ncbi:MAG: hypothetical protein EPN84_08045 [Legionella sp.]|nr:MAG: hypothetical protein EPN84_08045 [Legionella sp.]
MYKNLTTALAFVFTLVLSQAVFADSWGCGEGMKQMISSMKLDSAQKDKIKPILDQLKSSIRESGSQMKDLDLQINQQSVSADMDQSTVDSLVDKKAKLIGDMMKAKITAKNQIFAVLNAKQKIELQNMMQKLEEKMAKKYASCHQDD